MLAYTVVHIPLGQGTLISSNMGLCYFGLYQHPANNRCWLKDHFPEESLTMAPDFLYLKEAVKQLNDYLAGRLRIFSLPLDLRGTTFQIAVWQALLTVPYGKTVTYGDLAVAAGHPRAARAVGSAMRANPLPLFVPCHRVLPADGTLGGYGGGRELKRRLLELEGSFTE
ncbi:MAG: methylated-DNA--[protein]-cysteine S-methyltransferase [Firmicutes bacterium]|jgi:methylated-DNA-[protein]-cysteine S-methyltransferase|nr:methylated-DNA--[protein]-cysteine S-methyltransferase [Bacillota bacterium]